MNVHALVVDDSGIMRKMVMRALKESELAHFSFTEAVDGQDGIEKFDEQTTQMIFVDWNMPRMNGVEFIRAVRAKAKKHVPIVMITTEGSMGKMDEAMEQVGIDKYIAKPFTADGLKVRLGSLFTELAEAQSKPKGFFGKLAQKIA